MRQTRPPLSIPLLLCFLLAFASTVSGLFGQDQVVYNQAIAKYEAAHTVWPMTRANFRADPQREWRDGPMKARWLARARETGVIHLGGHQNPLTLGRKITYFSTPIQWNGEDDQLARDMNLRVYAPGSQNAQQWDALIFWKHVGGVSTPLKVDYVRSFDTPAHYHPLVPLSEVIAKGASRVRPL